jgi:indole-3-glycerol phosphate synthase
MSSFLRKIIGRKLEEIEELTFRLCDLEKKRVDRREKFIDLKRQKSRNIIAEIKRRSPSKGVINQEIDPRVLAQKYIRGGAKGISVLTDETFFGGSREDLLSVVNVSGDVPVLRKDFILDSSQVFESYFLGADMILLIVKILDKVTLRGLIVEAQGLGMTPVVEVHTLEELNVALECDAHIIGINNRNLDTFEVDISTSEKILPHIPDEKIKVVESGIKSSGVMSHLEEKGADAFLIGESLMSADDPEDKLKSFVKKSKMERREV